MKAEEIIKNGCNEWAKQQKLGKIDFRENGWPYFFDFRDSFFQGLAPETEKELNQGDGKELQGDDPKAKALRSSTVLVVNFCQHWQRTKDQVSILAEALTGDASAISLAFEAKHKTNVRKPANLDLELCYGSGKMPVAVEAKFSECYAPRKQKDFFRAAYFDEAHKHIWKDIPECRKLAEQIEKGTPDRLFFERLDAAQLLKHSLALSQDYGARKFQLLFLWYDVSAPPGSPAAAQVAQLREEIEIFRDRVGDEVNFVSKTYQEVFDELQKLAPQNADYFAYMTDRYFPTE